MQYNNAVNHWQNDHWQKSGSLIDQSFQIDFDLAKKYSSVVRVYELFSLLVLSIFLPGLPIQQGMGQERICASSHV